MNLIVLDTETSDLYPDQGAKILELAWIELVLNDKTWERANTFESYIQFDGIMNVHARAVNHIDPVMCTAELGAIPREDAIQCLLGNVYNDTIVVAHNAEFDSKFIPELKCPWICTMRSAKHVWPQAPGYSNQVAAMRKRAWKAPVDRLKKL